MQHVLESYTLSPERERDREREEESACVREREKDCAATPLNLLQSDLGFGVWVFGSGVWVLGLNPPHQRVQAIHF